MMIDELRVVVSDYVYKTIEILLCYSTVHKKVLF